MIYLVLAVFFSSMISIMMRIGERRCDSAMGMFLVNYFVCAVLSCLYAGRIAVYTPAPGIGLAIGLGCTAGLLFLLCFVLLRLNIRKNGMAMASTFMKLGVVISTLIAVFVFHETPRVPQLLGLLLAVVSILMIHTDQDQALTAPWKYLLPVLLFCGGVTDSMANVFDKVGDSALKDYYLFYTFAAALLCSLLIMLSKRERVGRRELIAGVMVGIPNYFSTRFLLLALGEVSAVIVYPAVSAGTIILVALAGRVFFGETLSLRKRAALGVIALALVLLNM